MLRNSFIFLPAVGVRTEKRLWSSHILTWNDFLNAKKISGFSKSKKEECDKIIKNASKALVEENVSFFKKIPEKHAWRLYDSFKDKVVFLDIEVGRKNELILVGLFDGFESKFLVKGVNLEKDVLFRELERYKLLITFNGGSFDIPLLERYFKTAIDLPHIDLKHCCQKLGLNGGLKEIEKVLDLKRPNHLYGNPSDLWRAFYASRDREYLELLLRYNEEDIVNLKPIAELCFKRLKESLIKVEV